MSLQLRPDGILDPKGKYPNPFTGQPYSKCYFEQSLGAKGWSTYVTWTDHSRIFNMIHKNSIVLLIAATGAGKTVTIPKLLLHYFGYQYPIICTTPRQATTSGAAEYAAICMDVPIFYADENCKSIEDPNIPGKDKRIPTGNTFIGYKYPGANFNSSSTKLLFSTDGTIKMMTLGDPNLSKYAGVIIDEAHERSVNIDILIALLLDICKRRPEFKVIIMSATIDPKVFTDYFERLGFKGKYDVYVPKVNNTQFPIDFRKEIRRIDRSKLVDVVYNKIDSIIMNPTLPTGDILAFVTSEAETVKVEKLIKRNIDKFPLHKRPYTITFTAQISQKDKDMATKKESLKKLAPNPREAPNGYAMKVIIATNVVESSVTFEDPLVYVVETGLAFEKKYDAANYCYETGKFYVSQASIKQRCGRTGRKNAGYCMQLYTDQQFTQEFIQFTPPKIVLEDITKELLAISCLPQHGNVKLGLQFLENMIEPVKNYNDAIRVAHNNLVNMGFANEAGDITPLGRVCNSFSKFDIKIAKMIIGGYYLGCMWYCIVLGGLLQEIRGLEDLFFKPPGMEASEVEDMVLKNMMKFKDNSGDHITLLKIYYFWQQSANKRQFCSDNGLNDKILSKVENSITELHEIVKNSGNEIRSLWLFGVPQEILTAQDALLYGGGKRDVDSDSIISDSTYSDITDSDLESDIDDTDSSLSTLEKNIDDLFKTTVSNPLVTPLAKQFDVLDDQFQTFLKGGDFLPELNKHTTENAQQTLHTLTTLHTVHDKTKHKHTLKSATGKQRSHSSKTVKSIDIFGGGKKEDKETRKLEDERVKEATKKLEKILNVVSLKDLKPMYLNPPASTIEQLIGALFYGYSTNIASYSGVGKKYTVKYSNIKGSISKSILDVANITPDLIMYHEFVISKEQNRESSKLSIVSGLSKNTLSIFLSLDDLRKKIR